MKQAPTRLFGSPWGIPALLAGVHLILALFSFHQVPYTGGDDATYISLARSLLDTHQYRDIWDPAQPPHTQYPPMFPLLVAGALAAGLDTVTDLRLIMVAISTLAVFFSCRWLTRVTSIGVATCAGLFIAISPEVIRLGMEVLSDYTFWLFSMLAVLAWLEAEKQTDGGTIMPTRSVVIATILTLLAYFTRSAGAPLLLAVFLWLAMQRQLRALALSVAMSAIPIGAWWLRGHNAGAGGYLAPFLSVDPYNPKLGNATVREIIHRFARNTHEYSARHIPRMLDGSPKQMIILGAAIGILAIIGWWIRAKKPSLTEVWFPIYVLLVLLWPVTWGGARFLMPVAPLIALYAAEPIALFGRVAKQSRAIAMATIAGAMFLIVPDIRSQIELGTACRGRYEKGEQFPCTDPAFADFFESAELARNKLPAGSVVLSRKPTIFFLHSGYKSRLYPLFAEPDSLFNLASRIGAKYVVVDQISDLAPRYLHPVLKARRDDFCVVPELSVGDLSFAKIEIGGPPLPPGSPPNTFRLCPLSP